jgi:hypothetical protein
MGENRPSRIAGLAAGGQGRRRDRRRLVHLHIRDMDYPTAIEPSGRVTRELGWGSTGTGSVGTKPGSGSC